jgi:hypothetical protein
VYLPTGVEGFVETAALTAPPRPPAGTAAPAQRPPQQATLPPPADPQRQQIDQATSTNLAKRDQLSDSIQTAAGSTSAFELSG